MPVGVTIPSSPLRAVSSGASTLVDRSGTPLAPTVSNTLKGASMAELSTAQRDKLKDAQFAYIGKDGERHLPIHDESHVRNALQRFGQTHFENAQAKKQAAQAILKAAKSHDIEVDEDDDVMRAAGH